MTYCSQVKEFTEACNDNLPTTPQRMTPESKSFIIEMVKDELLELEEAETIEDEADALVDAIYYICDCAVKQGIDLDKIFNIVHGANMQKVENGKVIRRDDGKVLKPESWKDPQPLIKEEIERQLNQ